MEKEIWLRKRMVSLRTLIDYYPDNKWVIECLREYEMWMHLQPLLFSRVQDSFGQDAYDPTGLFRNLNDNTGNEREREVTQQAMQSIRKCELELADRFLSNHPESSGVAWAHNIRLESLERQLYDLYAKNPSLVPNTREQILIEGSEYCKFLSRTKHERESEIISISIDYFNSVAVEVLLEGVESFPPDERTEQLAYLEKVRQLFPNDDNVATKFANLASLGQPFELAFDDLVSGRNIDLRQYRGKVVLVVFWATWCEPCLRSIPFLRQFRDVHRDHGVQIVGVSADGVRPKNPTASNDAYDKNIRETSTAVQKVRDCIVEHGIDWPVCVDEGFHRRWGVKSIPRTFVIDRMGHLCWISQDDSVYRFASELLMK